MGVGLGSAGALLICGVVLICVAGGRWVDILGWLGCDGFGFASLMGCLAFCRWARSVVEDCALLVWLLRVSSLCMPLRSAAAPWAADLRGGGWRGRRYAFLFWNRMLCWSRIWLALSSGFLNAGAASALRAFKG